MSEASPDKVEAFKIEDGKSPGMRSVASDLASPEAAEEFANKVFNPNEFMAFEETVKNICLLTTKQGKFEKRRDDSSRRAYGSRANPGDKAFATNFSEEDLGYSDAFILTARSKDTSNAVKDRFNQHTKRA